MKRGGGFLRASGPKVSQATVSGPSSKLLQTKQMNYCINIYKNATKKFTNFNLVSLNTHLDP